MRAYYVSNMCLFLLWIKVNKFSIFGKIAFLSSFSHLSSAPLSNFRFTFKNFVLSQLRIAFLDVSKQSRTHNIYIYWKETTITWCFHKQNYYMFYRHANIQRTYRLSIDHIYSDCPQSPRRCDLLRSKPLNSQVIMPQCEFWLSDVNGVRKRD
jgi:hypothetical protein